MSGVADRSQLRVGGQFFFPALLLKEESRSGLFVHCGNRLSRQTLSSHFYLGGVLLAAALPALLSEEVKWKRFEGPCVAIEEMESSRRADQQLAGNLEVTAS